MHLQDSIIIILSDNTVKMHQGEPGYIELYNLVLEVK
jgi:hypothetical protein